MTEMDEVDLVQRDSDLAWELFEVQPTHPEIPRLVHRVLAEDSRRSGMRILLAMHRKACDDIEGARETLHDVIARRDRQFINAARQLRDLAEHECNYPEARRWAEAVLREDQEDWLDWMEFGAIAAMSGDFELGWQRLDDAVAHCARTSADDVPSALLRRAIFMLQSFAPPERFIPAAEEAMEANPADEFVGIPLTWAYLHQGRFDDAEELCLRMLRLNPTEELPEIALTMIRSMRSTIEQNDLSMDQVHDAGILKQYWTRQRDEQLGVDLVSALNALEQVMPDDLRAALRPAADEATASESPGQPEIAAWHDGQQPGTGSAWGIDGGFRLMSAAEVGEMDDEIEANPDDHPEWKEEVLSDAYTQVMTDDAGGYVIAMAPGTLVVRRRGAEDEVIAPTLADWVWDRVRAFGGRDPRPLRPTEGQPAAGADPSRHPLDPPPDVLAEIDRLNNACRAAPEELEPQIALWKAVAGLERWVVINRGTPDDPRPYALSVDAGPMLCIYSSATRAQAAARAEGLVPDGAPVPLFAVLLPEALDWAMSYGERGVVGVTLDHPQVAAWCPLANLAQLKAMRQQS